MGIWRGLASHQQITTVERMIVNLLQLKRHAIARVISRFSSHSPQALAWGTTATRTFCNRFNGFRFWSQCWVGCL